MSFDQSGPVPSVDFEYPDDGAEKSLEAASQAAHHSYRAGSINSIRAIIGLLDDCRTTGSARLRIAVLRHLIEREQESVPRMAKRLGISESLVYREIREMRKFTNLL